MKKILFTGFEPFGGERINPSWEAVRNACRALYGTFRNHRCSQACRRDNCAGYLTPHGKAAYTNLFKIFLISAYISRFVTSLRPPACAADYKTDARPAKTPPARFKKPKHKDY